MSLRLFIAGGAFNLAAHHTVEEVTRSLTAPDRAALVGFELLHGDSVLVHASDDGEWAVTTHSSTY